MVKNPSLTSKLLLSVLLSTLCVSQAYASDALELENTKGAKASTGKVIENDPQALAEIKKQKMLLQKDELACDHALTFLSWVSNSINTGKLPSKRDVYNVAMSHEGIDYPHPLTIFLRFFNTSSADNLGSSIEEFKNTQGSEDLKEIESAELEFVRELILLGFSKTPEIKSKRELAVLSAWDLMIRFKESSVLIKRFFNPNDILSHNQFKKNLTTPGQQQIIEYLEIQSGFDPNGLKKKLLTYLSDNKDILSHNKKIMDRLIRSFGKVERSIWSNHDVNLARILKMSHERAQEKSLASLTNS